jgi:hypothetical protein
VAGFVGIAAGTGLPTATRPAVAPTGARPGGPATPAGRSGAIGAGAPGTRAPPTGRAVPGTGRAPPTRPAVPGTGVPAPPALLGSPPAEAGVPAGVPTGAAVGYGEGDCSGGVSPAAIGA